jgi:hypothetical protein
MTLSVLVWKDQINGEAIESDVMEYIAVKDDGFVEDMRDNDLLNSIYLDIWSQLPDYSEVDSPMLAIVPDGDFNPSTPLDASEELRMAADQFWMDTMLPWIRARTAAYQQEAPHARIINLDSPNHHIFIDRVDEVVDAMGELLESLGH